MEMFLRDAERLVDCRERVNLCPLGSGAVAGTMLPLDRVQMAGELGFAGTTANSMDATSDRDFAIEFTQAISLLAVHLSRVGGGVHPVLHAEYGFVGLPETYATGSSAMPQKKNPDSLELIRGKAGRVIGSATTLLITAERLAAGLQQGLAGDAGAGLRQPRKTHDFRAADRHGLLARRGIRLRAHDGRRRNRAS